MIFRKHFRFLLATCLISVVSLGTLQGQKVGLVLSGGGASGMAHIGVIKALEENNIPIDYITGTSMGAMVGALYASGYTVDEMISFAKSEDFQLAVVGDLPESDMYYFSQDIEDASVFRLKISLKKIIEKSLPANVVAPDLMEYILIDKFAPPAAAAGYDFDKLMIPFRCVASDIVEKKQVVFKSGNLPVALRASTTYPFYYKPIMVDSTLLFDGGLYNNFPADIMVSDFAPDVILGSNVAAKLLPPEEDDLLSQLRAMITSKSDFEVHHDKAIVIEPKSEVGVFDFSNIDKEIQLGYQSTLAKIDSIKRLIPQRTTATALRTKRSEFRARFPNRTIDKINVTGDLNKPQTEYISSTMGPLAKDSVYSLGEFRPQFLRLAQDGKIKYVQPILNYDSIKGAYNVDLHVKRETDFTLYFGGNFSSRPVNMGYVGLKYDLFGRTSASLFANSYFGKFYGSVLLSAKVDFGGKKRFSLTPHFVFNRWDYFKNFSTFFELSRPSYIVKNERYGGLTFASSWGNNTVVKADFRFGETSDRYYQTENFTAEDTTDVTDFSLLTTAIGIDRNTLNRKLYASNGSRLQVYVRGVNGYETTEYGSTSTVENVYEQRHYWVETKLAYENYFGNYGPLSIGFQIEGLYSTKPFYENYTASLISAPAYQPIPESKTVFIDEFRTTKYVAGGLRNVLEIRKNLEVRLEGYAFVPGKAIVRNESNKAEFADPFEEIYFIGASALVYHSPLGPLSLNLNFYDQREEGPWTFFFNFGFTIFNKSVYEL